MSRKVRSLVFASSVAVGIAAVTGVLYAYHLSNPQIEIPAANREKFANVVVLLDGTRSISDTSFSSGKQVVTKGIIPSCGLGDRLATYSIGPEFGLSNVISGATLQEQPPQFGVRRSSEVLDILRQSRSANAPGRVRSKLYGLVNETQRLKVQVEQVRSHWSDQIGSMQRPLRPGTNLTCAFDAVNAYFQASSAPDEERWLFVVSDLIQERALATPCSPAGETTPLAGVRIVLLYPHDSLHDWRTILDFWRRFFGDRKVEVYPISAALNRPFILPPNPLTGLESYRVRGFWPNLGSLISSEEKSPLRPGRDSE